MPRPARGSSRAGSAPPGGLIQLAVATVLKYLTTVLAPRGLFSGNRNLLPLSDLIVGFTAESAKIRCQQLCPDREKPRQTASPPAKRRCYAHHSVRPRVQSDLPRPGIGPQCQWPQCQCRGARHLTGAAVLSSDFRRCTAVRLYSRGSSMQL
eukprot:COSAG02_NODE_19020_length_905_cov_0.533499_1_plen_152_part_00